MYIQADILGQQRGLKFGSLAAQQITLKVVQLGADTGEFYTAPLIANIIYWGLYNNSYVKNETLDVTFEQVCDWVDDALFDPSMEKTITDIVNCYEQSKQSKLVMERLSKAVDDVKKNNPLTSTVKADGSTYVASQSGS